MTSGGALRVPSWTWRDLITFGALFVSGLMWGLKLDSRLEQIEQADEAQIEGLERRVSLLEGQLSVGVLPRTDERLRAIERDIEDYKRQRAERIK